MVKGWAGWGTGPPVALTGHNRYFRQVLLLPTTGQVCQSLASYSASTHVCIGTHMWSIIVAIFTIECVQ